MHSSCNLHVPHFTVIAFHHVAVERRLATLILVFFSHKISRYEHVLPQLREMSWFGHRVIETIHVRVPPIYYFFFFHFDFPTNITSVNLS